MTEAEKNELAEILAGFEGRLARLEDSHDLLQDSVIELLASEKERLREENERLRGENERLRSDPECPKCGARPGTDCPHK
jgi:hypothetical protein